MTDDLGLGAHVWSKARKGPDETRAAGGCVVDAGVNDLGEYVIVLDDGILPPIKSYKLQLRAVARRIAVADLDETLTQAPRRSAMVRPARRALLTVGCGQGNFSTDEKELLLYAATLIEAACGVGAL